MSFTRILVPLDGSALAETAIPTAAQFAKDQRAVLSLMRGAGVFPPEGKAQRVQATADGAVA